MTAPPIQMPGQAQIIQNEGLGATVGNSLLGVIASLQHGQQLAQKRQQFQVEMSQALQDIEYKKQLAKTSGLQGEQYKEQTNALKQKIKAEEDQAKIEDTAAKRFAEFQQFLHQGVDEQHARDLVFSNEKDPKVVALMFDPKGPFGAYNALKQQAAQTGLTEAQAQLTGVNAALAPAKGAADIAQSKAAATASYANAAESKARIGQISEGIKKDREAAFQEIAQQYVAGNGGNWQKALAQYMVDTNSFEKRGQPSLRSAFQAAAAKLENPANLKPLPVADRKAVVGGRQAITEIDKAISLLEKNPDAIGFVKGRVPPDYLNSYLDPKKEHIQTRTAIQNVNMQKLHEIYGARLTKTELDQGGIAFATIHESPQSALQKLQMMRAYLASKNDITEQALAGQYKMPKFEADNTPKPKLEPADAARANTDPKFRAFLKSKGLL